MFVGRESEMRELSALWNKASASLVTCRGRRRIGKSTLIEEFAKRTADNFLVFEGLAPRKGLSDKRQRQHFCEALAHYCGHRIAASGWADAFESLNAAIPESGRTVVLLDEISWLAAYNPDFAGYLKVAWDRFFSKRERLVLVICGSVSSWVADNVLNSTGFVGRTSLDLNIGELHLPECVELLGPSARRLSSRELLDFLSVTGGVPKYLMEVHAEQPLEMNVLRMCFSPNGLLFREFEETFAGVFGRKAETRKKALMRLAMRPLSVSELAKTDGSTASGRLTRTLRELEYAGFVRGDGGVNPETGMPLRQERYRISDNYTHFYLKCIAPHYQAIERGLFKFASIEQFPEWEGLLGLQFENVILNHVTELFPYLGLDRSLVLSAAPYVRRGKKGDGVQIDLLIQTRRMLMVVEIKRRREIGHGIVGEVEAKVAKLRHRGDLSVRTALVYEGELAPSVQAEHYFDYIVPASVLLGV